MNLEDASSGDDLWWEEITQSITQPAQRRGPIVIPRQLVDAACRFIKIKSREKGGFETGWSTPGGANYSHDDELFQIWITYRRMNYGVLCSDTLLVVDADDPKISDIAKTLPKTFTVETGGGGRHFYYSTAGAYIIPLERDGKNVGHLRAEGAMVVGPGSIHPNGKPYRVLHDEPIADINFKQVLNAFTDYIKHDEKPVIPSTIHRDRPRQGDDWISRLTLSDVGCYPDDVKRTTANSEIQGSHPIHGSTTGMNFCINERQNVWYCHRCGSGGGPLMWLAVAEDIISCDDAHPGVLRGDKFKKVIERAEELGLKPQESGRIRRQMAGDNHDASRFNPEITANFQKDDVGNSDRFLFAYGKDVLFNLDTGQWHIWDGQTWRIAHLKEMIGICALAMREIYKEATTFETKKDIEQHFIFARKSNTSPRIQGALSIAASRVKILNNEFDRHFEKINMANGVYDLHNMSFTPGGVKSELHSKNTGIQYDPSATCPKWRKHIANVFQNNDEMIKSFQASCGYCLLGSNSELFFIPYGCGKNGKSVTLQTLVRVMGDYGINIDPETLLDLKKQGGSAPKEDLFSLNGKRFGFSSEPSKKVALNTALIKAITGGDRVRCRPLYGRQIEYEPSVGIWLATNHMPVIRETTEGIKSRIRMFPFTHTIPVEERRNQREVVEEFIKEEGSGIFNWMLEGLQIFHDNGDRIPECELVTSATRNMFALNDTLGRCLSDTCMRDPNGTLKKTILFEAVLRWCQDNDEETFSKRGLNDSMIEKGFVEGRSEKERFWKGLRVKRPGEEGIIQLF